MPLERLILPSPEWLVGWGWGMLAGVAIATAVWAGFLCLKSKWK